MINWKKEFKDYLSSLGVTFNEIEQSIHCQDQTFHLQDLHKKNYRDPLPKKGVYIWEDQWKHKQEAVKSMLCSKLGMNKTIYGRNTLIKKIDTKTANNFIDQFHLLGSANSRYKYGIFYKDTLVGVGTFSGKTKIPRKGIVFESYVLIRYCSLNGLTVVGGMSKLINTFIKEKKPDDIMTYADKDWSDGNVYKKIGFHLVDETPICTFSVNEKNGHRTLISKKEAVELSEKLSYAHNNGNLKFLKKFK